MTVALAVIAVSLFSYFRIFDLYELQTYDWRCQLRGPRPVSEDIVLIDIWDDTVKTLGAWPFDRENHAHLIRFLSEAGVKALVFDILFVEPQERDKEVVQAAKAAKNVYFAFAFSDPKSFKGRILAENIDSDILPAYREAAKGVGYVNTKADVDGKRRRIPPVITYHQQDYYQLGFQVAMDVLGIKKEEVILHPKRYLEFSNQLKIPLDHEGYFIVNYAGKWEKTFKHYSYLDILASYIEIASGEKPRIDLNQLKGKICIVGLTTTGSHDTNPIPIQSIYPMVGSYANVINSILLKSFVCRLDRVWNLAICLFLGCWIACVCIRFKPLAAFLNIILTLVFFTTIALFVFFRWGVWMDLFYPVALFTVIYAVTTLGRVVLEMRKRELMEGELKIASQIQKSFLPAELPKEKGLSVAVYMKPAKHVGGDLYAFLTPAQGKVGVMVGDVSGKGTPAALFMAKVVSEFKFSAREKMDPARVLSSLNDSIASESTGGLFVTLIYAIFDVGSRRLLLSNGGHLPAVCVDQTGVTRLLETKEGMPIGVLSGVSFSNIEVPIGEGDCFAFYSDGVSEARNRKKEEYSVETLQKVISRYKVLSAQGILDKVVSHLNQFIGKADPHDDITLIIVKMESS